jgi:phosphoglycerol transferase MdoB-like AlkP superfamily enzyme
MKLLNTLLQVTLRLTIVMLAFEICRLLFLFLNKSFFPEIDVWSVFGILKAGLKFDAAAVLILNAPYIILMLINFGKRFDGLVKQFLKFVFVTLNLSAIIVNIIDVFYFPFTMERLTMRFFTFYLGTQKNLGALLLEYLVVYWYALIFLVAFIALIVRGYNRIGRIQLRIFNELSRRTVLIIVVVTIYLGTAAASSGFIPFKKMVTTADALETTNNLFEVAAITNTPYNIILSTIKTEQTTPLPRLKKKQYSANADSTFTKKNVVIFILESFTREASGLLNPTLEGGNYKGYTPFLDSLMQHSLYFINGYANGRRSIDAIPAILASVPAIINTPDENDIVSIGSLLKEEGYKTQFFHGADNGSMAFDEYCKKAGIDEYYGRTEFNNEDEFDGTWGIWDEPFLQYMAQKQLETQQPFFSTVFNLSSHNPFDLPAKYEGKFEEGIDPICKCISYSDYSIQQYFKTAAKMPWFKNTIFVFVADHSLTPWHREYATTEKAFAIPLFFYAPDGSIKGKSSKIAQQIDIMPTLLNCLDYPNRYSAIGNNLLNNNAEQWAITDIMKIPQVIEKDNFIKIIKSGEKIISSTQ